MTDDRLRRITDALHCVWAEQGRLFVTFESGADPDRWVQYIDGVLHLAWPFDEGPDAVLPRRGVSLPAAAFALAFQPGGTAQLAVGDLQLAQVAALADALLRDVLELRENEEVCVRILR